MEGWQHYLYLLINVFTLSIPMARSFDARAPYYKLWKPLFLSITIVGAFFIVWDVIFTMNGVWGFNDDYLVGFRIFHLPIEEWLFFVCVPYSSVFIYFVLNFFFPKPALKKSATAIAWAEIVALALLALLFWEQAYTFWTFTFLAIFMLYLVLVEKAQWLGNFFRAYVLVLLPFLMVNGILTGSFIEDPIVWYNNAQNFGIRLGTIPIEDVFYGQLLIMMNVWLLRKFAGPHASPNI